jgi:hypothetical protein
MINTPTPKRRLSLEERLHQELRKLAIMQRHVPAYGYIGTTKQIGFTCLICESNWPNGQPETHRASCVLVASSSPCSEVSHD